MVQISCREVPTFGQNTIWKFFRNMSEMKQLAAHDWEDLLQVRIIPGFGEGIALRGQPMQQCAIPVFDSLLLEPDNKKIPELLFILAYWQELAKLQLHTENTLNLLDNITNALGNVLQAFNTTHV